MVMSLMKLILGYIWRQMAIEQERFRLNYLVLYCCHRMDYCLMKFILDYISPLMAIIKVQYHQVSLVPYYYRHKEMN
jgi:hypothetical protein